MKIKAVSQVVTVVLLIFISIAAIALISAIIIPKMIKQPLMSPEITCKDFKINSILQITKACYNEQTKDLEITLERRDSNPEITKIDFVLQYQENSEKFTCDNNCVNCQILGTGKKKYYFQSDSQPSSVILVINDCDLAPKKIFTC
ncbi:MAG: hypothetical protein KKF56_04080 [Nanoarchaeota archaeon]|nr:hypothetical protein [Nanoarchaeota archaeon]